MRMKFFVSFVFVVICTQTSNAQGWRGIVPLHSTRTDVERLLGPSNDECKCIYKVDGEVIRVNYAKEPCKGYPSGWNVAADTVLQFTVDWKQEKTFSELPVDEHKYERAYDDTFTTYYSSREEGVQYAVSSDGMVRGVDYIPMAKDAGLRCPCFPPGDESVIRTPPFDEFAGKTIDDALARLDNFAIQLLQIPEWKGYVIVYGRKRTPATNAKRYTQRLRNHLVEKRGLPAKSVVMMNGGYREHLSVELYLLRSDIAPPKARPTYVPCRGKRKTKRFSGKRAPNNAMQPTRISVPLIDSLAVPQLCARG